VKKFPRCMAPALFVAVVFWSPKLCRGQSAFNGAWRIDAAQSKLSPQPNNFYIAKGWYHCTSCSPAIAAEADGKDHAVQGASYDTLNVRVVDLHTIELIARKNGKVMYDQTRTVSVDGKKLTVKTTVYPANSSKPVDSEIVAVREGPVPSGAHATSGEWKIEKLHASANGLTFTDKVSGGELTMTDPTGESFTARLDGTSAPVKGAYDFDSVSVKMINPHTMEETDMRNGTVVHVMRMTVKGSTMHIEATNKLTGRTDNLVAHRQ
jgi:hypothetical protein